MYSYLIDHYQIKKMSFNLDIQLKYASTNYSPAEYNPYIKCYLDGRFHKKNTTDVSLIDGSTKSVALSGTLRNGFKITTTTALCFASIAWRANESGSPCPMDTGVAHIEFGDIEREIKQNGRFDRIVPLKMYTVDQYQKAELHVVIHELGAELEPSLIGANGTTDYAPVNSYINTVLQQEQQMEETFGSQTSNMRIPYDYSESGMQSTGGMPLPAVAFLMGEIPESNDHYWVNALGTVMSRDGLKIEDWNRLNIKGRARATIHTLCYEAQYLDYIGDTVDRNTVRKSVPTESNARYGVGARYTPYNPQLVTPCENFGGELNAGDCEDLAFVNLSGTNSLIDHTFEKNCPHRSIMLEMQKIAEQYVDPLSLDVVRGAQVADQVDNFGAHMNDNYIPVPKFKEWLSTTREGRLLAKELNWPEAHPEADHLPFLVGEGTGMYECYGLDHPQVELMQYVYTCGSLEGFKKPITRQPGKSGGFMHGSLVGMTDYFYRRGAKHPMSFWYGKVQPAGKISRGVKYEDMMNEAATNSVAIKVHPPVTPAIMAQIEELTLRRIPRDPLILSNLPKDARRRHNSKLDFVCKSIARLHRSVGSHHKKVSVYVRPHQLLPGVAERIVGDFTAKERIWKVEYKLEEITDDMFGYRMDVYVQ